MRILLVAPYFQDSFRGKISMGSAVMAAKQLSRKHHVLVVTTGREKPKESLSNRLTILSAPGLLLPDPVNYVISPASLVLVVRQIRDFQPHLVIVNKFMFFTSFAAPIAKLMGKPTIFVTDTYPGLNWFPRNRAVAAVMWLYARVIGVPLLRLVDKVVLLHEGLTETALRYGLNFTVIHNGTDLSDADAAEPAPTPIKRAGEIWIGYVGRLESIKGYDILLKAVDPLLHQYPHVKAFFIGASRPKNLGSFSQVVGASRPNNLQSSSQVEFLGFRNDVYSVLKQMDIFCLPSLSEGLPNALMEAMSVGCAPVASRVGGVPVLVEHGKNGLLVPPRDVRALQEALQQLIESSDLRKELGRHARQTIEARFNWNKIAVEYEELFETILRPYRPGEGPFGALPDRDMRPIPEIRDDS